MRRTYALTYGRGDGMIATMNELHPIAVELAKIQAEYDRTVARLAAIKATRRDKKRELRAAIVEAINANPDATHVDLAAPFAVTEGTVRHLRRDLANSES